MNQILQEIDENYQPLMLRWLIVIVHVLGTLFVVILCDTVYYLKYGRL